MPCEVEGWFAAMGSTATLLLGKSGKASSLCWGLKGLLGRSSAGGKSSVLVKGGSAILNPCVSSLTSLFLTRSLNLQSKQSNTRLGSTLFAAEVERFLSRFEGGREGRVPGRRGRSRKRVAKGSEQFTAN